MVVVGDYEFEAFGLLDTRHNWRIEDVLEDDQQDYLLLLRLMA